MAAAAACTCLRRKSACWARAASSARASCKRRARPIAAKLLKTDRVAVAFFGDGAVNNGAFHEGLNLAAIWKLPVLFVCENNQFATEVPFAYSAGNPSVAARGAMYGMPGVGLDGNDAVAIHQAAAEAILRRSIRRWADAARM